MYENIFFPLIIYSRYKNNILIFSSEVAVHYQVEHERKVADCWGEFPVYAKSSTY